MWRAVNATLARMTAASSSRGFAAVSTEGRALREIVLNGEDAWDKHHKQSGSIYVPVRDLRTALELHHGLGPQRSLAR